MNSKTEQVSGERWRRLQKIFDQAADLDDTTRSEFLDNNCGDDPELRREVEALLEANETGDGVIESVISRAAGKAVENRDREVAETEQHVGPYRILGTLGQGGMGAVYLAERADAQFHKQVAIKVLHSTLVTDETELRFRSERQILANLEHPNIAHLIDGGNTVSGIPYLVMEYVDGEPIHKYCDNHQLSIAERLELFCAICSAVAFAHRSLVVHRDIKPSNILVTEDGVPKLLDFGIAKILDHKRVQQTVAVTQAGDRLLTPDHASPEQILGRPVTTASDVYSLGILLYELLGGRRPYRVQGVSPAEMERIICLEQPESLSRAIRKPVSDDEAQSREQAALVAANRRSTPERLARRLRGDLDNIVLMALRKEPERRYASVGQFSGDIRKHLQGQPVAACPDTTTYRAGKFVRRNRVGVAFASAFVLFLAGFGVTMWFQAKKIAQERDLAERTLSLMVNVFEFSDPYSQRRDTTAVQILDASKDKISRELADQPEIRAKLRETIGRVYVKLGKPQEAVPLLEQSLATRRALFGRRHVAVAASLRELGSARIDMADYPKAIAALEESLQIYVKVHGEQHLDVAETLHQLGRAQRTGGDPDAAQLNLESSIAMYRELLGEDDEQLAAVISELASVYQNRRQFDESDRLFVQALNIFRDRRGDNHAEVGLQLLNLAFNQNSKGDMQAADRYYKQAIPVLIDGLGEDHAVVGTAKGAYAGYLKQVGRLEESEGMFREVIANAKRNLGESHENVGFHWAHLADVLSERRQWSESELAFGRAFEIYRIRNARIDWVIHAHWRLGRMLANSDQPARAELEFRTALADAAELSPENRWMRAAAASSLGGVLLGLHRYDEAEPLLLDAYESLGDFFPRSHPLPTEARELLVKLYRDQGRLADARRYQQIPEK